MAPLHKWHTSKPHLMKLFIDRLAVIGARQYSFVHSSSAFLEPYNLYPALTSGSPEWCIRKASSQLCSKLCHNFQHLVTIGILSLTSSQNIFSEDLPWHRVLNRKEIYCIQSDIFNSDQPAAMNYLSLALSHKPSPTDNHR